MKKKKILKKDDNFKIVLNGGSTQMLDATIPVKWFFSEDFIKQEPKYILLVDLNEYQLDSGYHGKRYVYSVEEVVAFIQARRSGKHTMLALAFNDKKEALSFLESEKGSYKLAIPPCRIKDGEKWGGSLASTYVEFEVPKDLFAQKPKSKLGKIWWKYLFWPNSPKAIDECQVRKIALFYALPKLPFFILAKILLLIIYFIYAIYHLIARPISLFIGWWPITLKETFKKISSPKTYNWSLDVREGFYLEIFWKGKRTKKEMFTSPLILLLIFSLLILVAYFMLNMGDGWNFTFGFLSLMCFSILTYHSGALEKIFKISNDDSFNFSFYSFIALFLVSAIPYLLFFKIELWLNILFLVIGLFITLIVIFHTIGWIFNNNKDKIIKLFIKSEKKITSKLNKKAEKERKKEEKARKKKEEYQQYLKKFTKSEEIVNIDNLPGTYEKNKLKRDARIKFWTIKTKVCRPYEQ